MVAKGKTVTRNFPHTFSVGDACIGKVHPIFRQLRDEGQNTGIIAPQGSLKLRILTARYTDNRQSIGTLTVEHFFWTLRVLRTKNFGNFIAYSETELSRLQRSQVTRNSLQTRGWLMKNWYRYGTNSCFELNTNEAFGNYIDRFHELKRR